MTNITLPRLSVLAKRSLNPGNFYLAMGASLDQCFGEDLKILPIVFVSNENSDDGSKKTILFEKEQNRIEILSVDQYDEKTTFLHLSNISFDFNLDKIKTLDQAALEVGELCVWDDGFYSFVDSSGKSDQGEVSFLNLDINTSGRRGHKIVCVITKYNIIYNNNIKTEIIFD